MLSINIGLLADGRRRHDVTAARRAAVCPFCVLQVLNFCTLTPTSILNLTIIVKKPIKRRFQQYLVRTEILSTFKHESNTFLDEQTVISPIQTNGLSARHTHTQTDRHTDTQK